MTGLTESGFRMMTVIGVERLTPRLRRLRLGGQNLGHFDVLTNLHVRLHVPARMDMGGGHNLSPPVLDVTGRPVIDQSSPDYVTRYYTIRRIDANAGWMDVDFVLHDTPGPAADFARQAKPGDTCGISGPCGLGAKPARRYLLAGDETALPAISRIVEHLPQETRGLVLIETQHDNGRTNMTAPPGIDIDWFERHRRSKRDFVKRTIEAVEAFRKEGGDYFLWIAVEHSDWQAIRPYLQPIPKARYIHVAYWTASPMEATR